MIVTFGYLISWWVSCSCTSAERSVDHKVAVVHNRVDAVDVRSLRRIEPRDIAIMSATLDSDSCDAVHQHLCSSASFRSSGKSNQPALAVMLVLRGLLWKLCRRTGSAQQEDQGLIAKWAASSVRVPKVTVRFPAAQKCWAQMAFVNIYQFRFHPMLKYACVYCVRFVLINLQHCGQPWRWLVAAYSPC